MDPDEFAPRDDPPPRPSILPRIRKLTPPPVSYWSPQKIENVFDKPLATDSDLPALDVAQYDFGTLNSQLWQHYDSQIQPEASLNATDSSSAINSGDRSTPANDASVERGPLDWSPFLNLGEFLGSGGSGDVHKGKWIEMASIVSSQALPRVVIKKFRVSPTAVSKKIIKQLLREIAVCQTACHPNIVPFLGVYQPSSQFPALVAIRIENGNVLDFIKRYASNTCLRNILAGIATGLHYLHTAGQGKPSIIHGDLKGENVLINSRGQPCLCDFGLSRMLVENTLWNTSAVEAGGTQRWMAPELLDGTEKRVTSQSDLFAFGMTSYEILSGRVPLHQYRANGQALVAVLFRNERPQRDAECITDDIWAIMENAWDRDASQRRTSQDIFDLLSGHNCWEHPKECVFRDIYNTTHDVEDEDEE